MNLGDPSTKSGDTKDLQTSKDIIDNAKDSYDHKEKVEKDIIPF